MTTPRKCRCFYIFGGFRNVPFQPYNTKVRRLKQCVQQHALTKQVVPRSYFASRKTNAKSAALQVPPQFLLKAFEGGPPFLRLAVGGWWLVVGGWLLVVGCWLLSVCRHVKISTRTSLSLMQNPTLATRTPGGRFIRGPYNAKLPRRWRQNPWKMH